MTRSYQSTDRHPAPETSARRSWFEFLLPIALIGYLFLDRAFAWVHVPRVPIFVGEIVMLAAIPLAVRVMRSPEIWRRTDTILVLLVFAGWGFLRSLPSLIADDPFLTYRDAVIWVYFAIGLAVTDLFLRRPASIRSWLHAYRRLVPWIAIWLPVSGVIDALDINILVPDSPVTVLAHKPGNAIVHLFIAGAFLWTIWSPDSHQQRRNRVILSVALTIGVLVLATQTRGGFVAVVVALALLLIYMKDRVRIATGLAVVILVAVVALLVVDPAIPGGSRQLSSDQLIQNVTSIITQEGEGALGANINWRYQNWGRVWTGVNQSAFLVGHGFGVNLATLYDIPQADIGLRNPHNSHLSILARLGWIGAALWLLLLTVWFVEINRARSRFVWTDNPGLSGLSVWVSVSVVALLVNAVFDPTLESPQVGLWFWSLFGLGLALVIASRSPRWRGPVTDHLGASLKASQLPWRRPDTRSG